MEFSDTNPNISEEANILIPETTDNPLELSQTSSQQLNSFENQQVEETAELLADSIAEMSIPVVEEITVMGDMTGDGGLDFDDVRELLRSYRSGMIDPDDPRDINGDGRLSLLDIRELGLVVRNNTDKTAPNFLVGLVNDTGSLNNDQLTSDPSISGTLSDESLITRFTAGFNDTSVDNYVNILGVLNEDGTFSLDETQLQEINNNNPLEDGEHTLHFFTKDQWNNITTFDINFVLDSNAPNIGVSLLNDLGISDTDNISSDPTLTGNITDFSDIETLEIRNTLEPIVGLTIARDITNLIDADGNFIVNTDILSQIIPLSPLFSDSVYLVGTDRVGNVSSPLEFSFTVDSQKPLLSIVLGVPNNLLLGNVQDNPLGDTGVATLTIQIDEGEITDIPFSEGEQFTVSLNDFNLTSGEHLVTITATDVAGNNIISSQNIIVDNASAQLTIGLTNDTGRSDSDNISSILGITGTLIDDNPITTFEAGLNNGGTLDVLDTLQPDGTFIFDEAKLLEIATASLVGLIPGEYTLNLTFNDGETILRSEDFTFTYDPIPTFPTVTTNFSQPITETTLLTGSIVEDLSGLDRLTYRFGEGEEIDIIVDEFGNFSQPFDLTGVPNGIYDIFIESVDIAGNGLGLSLDNIIVGDINIPNLTLNLVDDTGVSNNDSITQNFSFIGTVTDESEITILDVTLTNSTTGFSNTISILNEVQPDGSFAIDETVLQQINQGQPLTDGNYRLFVEVSDEFGNSGILFNPFLVLDRENPSLTINTPMNNGSINEGDRIIGNTDGTGSEIASISYQFNDGVIIPITVDNDGNFDQVLDLTGLDIGEQILTLTIVDVAGNETVNNLTLTIPAGDNTPPDITAMLVDDTGSSNNDLITNNPTISGTVNDASAITEFKAKFGMDPEEEFIDIFEQLQPDGSFNLDATKLQEINGNTELIQGQHTLQLIATDELGNTSDIFEFTFTLDSQTPIPTLTSSLSDGTTLIDLNFGETIVNATDLNNYTLTIVGGIRDGETIGIVNINSLGSQGVRLTLSEGLIAGENYSLDISSNIEDIAGNNLPENTALNLAVAPPSITEITPTDGSEMVSLTRETVVRFNVEIDPNTVTEESLYLIANGQRIAGRRVVSSTKKFVTFFYDEPLPSSTEIRVVVDGDKITTMNGIAIDADGDGNLGGIVTADFSTLPVTRIEGTDVFGYVFDSFNTDVNGDNIPVVGATIRLDALPDVFAVTDETGFFRLEDVPAPEFSVHIDGGTAINAPEGTVYATVGKIFHSVPGQETQLIMDGETFDVFLPPMATADIQPLAAEADTDVGFGEVSIAQLQALFPDIDPSLWDEVIVTFPAGSAQDEEGNVATQAAIIPVAPDRLPAPLPASVNPQLVISIQAGGDGGFSQTEGGATNFDVPAPIQFPNLEGLEPGEKTLIWSFDHDAGDWVVIGTGTVSDDGKVITSDEGVGILAPGWHFVDSGSETEGEGEDSDLAVSILFNNGLEASEFVDFLVGNGQPPISVTITTDPPNATVEWIITPVNNESGTVSNNQGTSKQFSFSPDVTGVRPTGGSRTANDAIEYRLAVTVTHDGETLTREVNIMQDTRAILRQEYLDYGLEIPALNIVGEAQSTTNFQGIEFSRNSNYSPLVLNNGMQEIAQGIRDGYGAAIIVNSAYRNPQRNRAVGGVLRSVHQSGGAVDLRPSTNSVENKVSLYRAAVNLDPGLVLLEQGPRQLLPGNWNPPNADHTFVSNGISIMVEDTAGDGLPDTVAAIMNAPQAGLSSNTQLSYAGGGTINPAFLIVDGNNNGIIDVGESLIFTHQTDRALRSYFNESSHTHADNQRLVQTANALPNQPLNASPANTFNISTASGFGSDSPLYYHFALPNNQEIRGRSNDANQFSTVLPANSDYTLTLYDAALNHSAIVQGKSSPGGQPTELGTIRLDSFGGLDTDGDGIPDVGERAIGTSPENTDTDNDGISDAAELEQGLDPLGGQGFPTGIIASLPLFGEANAVVVEGSTENAREQLAYVATGSHGLAIVDASQFDNPIILGQLNLNGNATDVAVDSNLGIAAVATNSGGLQLVDVSDPMLPTLIETVDIDNVNNVEIADGVAYVAGENTLQAIDLLTGDEINSLTLPGSGTVTDIARDGSYLYALTSPNNIFVSIDISSPDTLAIIGQTGVSVSSTEVGLSVGNGVAYLAGNGLSSIDISDPANPSLISGADSFIAAREIARNGSGLGLVATGNSGVELYDVSDPNDTDNFITRIDTPGFTNDIAIASGIAYVADGSGDLQVINYLSFDNQGVAPTVTISSNADLDPNTSVIEVLEGSSVPIQVDVTDDVQVRNVELLVNGEVVTNDVSFPFDLSAIALAELPGGTSATVQVRATDTGGNSTLSNLLTLEISPDTFAPLITSTTPNEGARPRGISAVTVRFNEAIDPSLLNVNGVTLTNFGEDGVLGTGDDISVTPDRLQLSESGTNLFIFAPDGLPFVAGEYELEIDPSIISDRAGNPLNDPFTLNFTQRDIEAIIFEEVVEGSIANPGENEIFTFTGEIGQRIFLDGISSDDFNIMPRLVSPSGVEVFQFFNGFNFDSNPITLIEQGTYQLIVEGGFSSATGDFSFRLLDADNATPLTVNSSVMGDIASNTSELFTFEGTEGDRIVFNNLDDDFNQFLTIYDPGNQFASSSSFNNPITLESTGTYIVAVSNNFSGNAVEDYNFDVRIPVTTVESLTIGETVIGDIDAPGNEDVYTFEGSAGQRLYLDGVFPDSDFFSAGIAITSPSGGQIPNFFGASTGSDSFAPFTLIEDGTYELTVRGSGTTGNYSFRVLDAAEATNITVDTLVEGTLTPGDSTQLFTFEGTEDQLIFLNEILGSLSTSLTLYGPSNQFLADESSSAVELPVDNTYLVVLEGFNSTAPLDYSFRLETPNIIPDTLTIGSTVDGTLNNSDEQISYSFEGTKGQRLVIDGLDNTFNLNLRLVSPSGQSVNSGFNTPILSSFDGNPFSLIETGTYELIVNGSGDVIGDFSFQVLDLATSMNLPLNTEISGTLDPGQETQLFTFEGQAGQTLLLDDLSSSFGGSYTLYNGGNEFLISTTIGSSSDPSITLTGDGRYFLVLRGFSNSPVDYTFQLTETAFDDPGDPMGTEIMIGETINSDISVAGEVDTYLFEGTIGQQLIFDSLSNNFFSGNVRLVTPTATFNNFFASLSSDSSPVTLIEDGLYQLTVSGFSTGDYSFRLLDIANATPITIDTTYSGTFDTGTSATIFTFEGSTDQPLFLSNDTSNYAATVYGPNNQVVNSNFTGNNNQLFTLPGEGTYTLVLSPFNFNGDSLNYNFELITPTFTETPLTLGETVNGSIDQLGEVDVYTFDANPGQRLYFDGLDSGFEGGANISIISPSGASIPNFFGSSTSFDSSPFTLLEGGTYELRVIANDTVTYNFRLLDVDQATSINLNTNVQGILDPGSATELFTFNGTQDQTLTLAPEFFEASYTVVSPGNQFVGSSGSDFTLPGDGNYVVVVSGSSFNNTPINYDFSIEEPTIIPASLTLGNTVNGTIANAGERIAYNFEGIVGQRLIYDGISGNSNINASLISPSGNELDLFGTFFNTDVNLDRNPITLIENGTYTLVVDGEGSTTGDFSFRLSNGNSAPTLNFNTTLQGTLDPNTIRVLRFNGVANQTVTLQDLGSDSFTGEFRLIGPGNQLITSSNFGSNFEATLPGNGTYFLLLDSVSNSLANYRFQVI
ncbi:MAG: Ig-like domain-containing protein [Crocosphaera sp.]|nr:Ig-like domain-containing protein [Crocosphaera sp.]